MNDLMNTAKMAARDAVTRVRPQSGLLSGLLAAGAVLGTAAIINTLAARRSERKHPPSGRFLEIDGVRLHYIEKGTGEPVVLIHGNAVTADDWRVSGVFDRLARSHRVIAFDRPGFGYTKRPRTKIWTAKAQAELLWAAMQRLGVEQAMVVGHSWGTLVAMSLALAHPSAVSRLVLMSGYYFPTPRVDGLLSLDTGLPVIGDVISSTVSPPLVWLFTPLILKQMFSPGKVTASFKARFPIGLVLRPSQLRASAAEAVLMVPEAAKTAGRHGELTMPVLIISGTGDKIVSFKHQSHALSRELPGSREETFEGGHMIHHLFPEEVAELIGVPTPSAANSSATAEPLVAAE